MALLQNREQDDRDRRDVEIINRNAKRLNREAVDVLEYQQLPLLGIRSHCSKGNSPQ